MDEIFISYRRDDAGSVAAAVAEALEKRFGGGSVFLDTRSLLPGFRYAPDIDAAVRRCLVVVVLIGPAWLPAKTTTGHRRIDDPGDWVRREISSALATGVSVLPVLLDGAALPRRDELPANVRGLIEHGLARLAVERLPADLDALCDHVARLVPRIGDRGRQALSAGPVQDNRVSGGGHLFANQGSGGMSVGPPGGPAPRGVGTP